MRHPQEPATRDRPEAERVCSRRWGGCEKRGVKGESRGLPAGRLAVGKAGRGSASVRPGTLRKEGTPAVFKRRFCCV